MNTVTALSRVYNPNVHSALMPRVRFDPSDPDHREAYRMLVEQGRMHPTLRFEQEPPFVDVQAMMERKLALYACQAI